MGLKLLVPPVTTPVSLAEAKAHLRFNATDTAQDALLQIYVDAATDYAEQFLGRALIDQTWEMAIDAFPVAEIKIPKPPLIEVISVSYSDPGGLTQVVSVSDYYVDNYSEPGWIVPQGNLTWPTTLSAINAVRVRFRAGYLDSGSSPASPNVPGEIIQAILLGIGSFNENREQIVVGETIVEMPLGVHELLRKHRILLGMA